MNSYSISKLINVLNKRAKEQRILKPFFQMQKCLEIYNVSYDSDDIKITPKF